MRLLPVRLPGLLVCFALLLGASSVPAAATPVAGVDPDAVAGVHARVGLPAPLAGGEIAVQVASNAGFTCALTSAGAVKCWGWNIYGQLGDGTNTDRSAATPVQGLGSGIKALSAGYYHACALTTGGGVLCWGNNSGGQLGDGTTTDRNAPVAVQGLSSGVTAIAAGNGHTCALMSGGGVRCWGANSSGQLGDGTTTDHPTPVAVRGLSAAATSIKAGAAHTCALVAGGVVQCWGMNDNGQLGDGTGTSRSAPITVQGLASGIAAIETGGYHTCAIDAAGGVKCWGLNRHLQLGDGTTTDCGHPVALQGMPGPATAIDAGEEHTCVKTAAGGVRCWGSNISGQLGDGTTTDRGATVAVQNLDSGVVSLGMGELHSCVVTTLGGIKCWGGNTCGELGDGTTTNRYAPVDVQGFGVPPRIYSITGAVKDGAGQPVGGVTLSAGGGQPSTVTDAQGSYTLASLPAGTYTLTPAKIGYTFTPAPPAVTVPPSATGRDFTATWTGAGALSYAGPLYLPTSSAMVDEPDHALSIGDHAHLRLPFRNVSDRRLTAPTIEVTGKPRGEPGWVTIQGASGWSASQGVALAPAALDPGQTGLADFWIYAGEDGYGDRRSLDGQTWIDLAAGGVTWRVPIVLSPIGFVPDSFSELAGQDCLHHPSNFLIKRYAQYAAEAAQDAPADDPDTPEQAVRNVVSRVSQFGYKDGVWQTRVSDAALLAVALRTGDVGVCRDYADLTIGLLRSLGLPARYTDADLVLKNSFATDGHAWAEAYLGPTLGWRQADSGWNSAIDHQWVYEADPRFREVRDVLADRYPLSTATYLSSDTYRCIDTCYVAPVDCIQCAEDSAGGKLWYGLWPDLSCVDDVTSHYHGQVRPGALGSLGERLAAAGDTVSVRVTAPVALTRTVPISVSAGITNHGLAALGPVTATVSTHQYADSPDPLLAVSPAYRVLAQLGPGETITATWTVTPLLTGSGLPIRVSVAAGADFAVAERPVAVNEPGTLPDLSLLTSCAPGTVHAGSPLTLTASVLDGALQPVTSLGGGVTATVFTSPTSAFSQTVTLTYCAGCGGYRAVVDLPAAAPPGDYEISYRAAGAGYDPGKKEEHFGVVPSPALTVTTSASAIGLGDALTVTAGLTLSGAPVDDAAVWAALIAPSGTVTAPLAAIGSGAYRLTVRPLDLAPGLAAGVSPGGWRVRVATDYEGADAAVEKHVTVRTSLYLPLIARAP